ncbi:hypothetical protein BJ875DRAFT_462800 [Amylocarpus encephaloides]|uniref:NAD(P)-binding protein n=1 Tax=Amylocarpus encephaloides TaxID=45428 RepID=A0A9P7YHZ1_9HELO|nr:hypothetical protein BJ875DRAFT_462800 [Amylocarpus encephaloides]
MSEHVFNAKTIANEVAALFSEQIKGKTVLVTGVAPCNLGNEFIASIAPHNPGLLILAGRSIATLTKVQDTLLANHPSLNTRLLTFDLSSLSQIRKAATEVTEIDVLINNAGIMACPYEQAKEVNGDVEMQLMINHVGPFLFTNLLLKAGKVRDGGRVIIVSSEAHWLSDLKFEDLGYSNGTKYDIGGAYGQSKTANVLFATSLAKLTKITALALHPGGIQTQLLKHMPEPMMVAMRWKNDKGEFVDSDAMTWKTLQEGAATHVIASFDPKLEGRGGSYLVDGNVAMEKCAPYARDEKVAERLWKISEGLVGENFEFLG